MKDPDSESKPSLRISHIVHGRERVGTRVLYLIDPTGRDQTKSIAENVVLVRWRKRVFAGHTFGGARLSPNLWRALPMAFGRETDVWVKLDEPEIQAILDDKRSLLREQHFTLPSANVLRALFATCGMERLQRLVDRHNHPDRRDRHGVPDLFLYATDDKAKRPVIARFVEVKKPDERVSPDQHEEIAFLQQLGLHARILRLIERD